MTLAPRDLAPPPGAPDIAATCQALHRLLIQARTVDTQGYAELTLGPHPGMAIMQAQMSAHQRLACEAAGHHAIHTLRAFSPLRDHRVQILCYCQPQPRLAWRPYLRDTPSLHTPLPLPDSAGMNHTLHRLLALHWEGPQRDHPVFRRQGGTIKHHIQARDAQHAEDILGALYRP